MEERILEVLDTRGTLKCVRFESGHVEIYPDGRVELIVWPKKKLTKQLSL